MAATRRPQRPPYAGAVSLGQSFGEGAPAPLSGDKQSYRCADQNQKSRNGRHNAYLFKGGHDPPPMLTPTRLEEQRSRTDEVAVRLPTQRVEIWGPAVSNKPPEPISGLTVFGIVPAAPARQPRKAASVSNARAVSLTLTVDW